MNIDNVLPLGDRVLVKVEKAGEKKTASGFILPESTLSDDVKLGTVIKVGNGLYTQNGVKIPMEVSVGDIVSIPPYDHQGQKMKLNGETYLLLRESELLMIIEKNA